MPYPFCRGDDRLCRELFRRQVQRATGDYDRGGRCQKCRKPNCYQDSCVISRVRGQQAAAVGIWETKIGGHQEVLGPQCSRRMGVFS